MLVLKVKVISLPYISRFCMFCALQGHYISGERLQDHWSSGLIFAQNIDCGYTLEPPQGGGSNEYPQSMFWSKNKKIMYTPVNPSFTL